MKRPKYIMACVLVVVGIAFCGFCSSNVYAQELANPFTLRSWNDIAEGKLLYGVFCQRCHSPDAVGGEGPNLIDDVWIHGSSDADVFRIIEEGVAKNGMESFSGKLTETEIWRVMTYLQSLARGRAEEDEEDKNANGDEQLTRQVDEKKGTPFTMAWAPRLIGYAEFGKTLFYSEMGPAACARCHAVQGQGGAIGPDLSDVAKRKSAEQILGAILSPHEEIVEGYRSVMLATRDGVFINGVVKKESPESIEIGDVNGTVFTIEQSKIDRLSDLQTSTMPGNFRETLTLQEFYDLIAYLRTLSQPAGTLEKNTQ
jgi:putative heme-binding domain-containing protein